MPAKVQMLRSSLVKSRSPRESNLEVRNLKSVVSDGARIMTGEYSGVAAPLRRINKVMPKITSIFMKVQTELQNLALTDNTKTFCQKKKSLPYPLVIFGTECKQCVSDICCFAPHNQELDKDALALGLLENIQN